MDFSGGDASSAEAAPAAFSQDPVAYLSAIAAKPPSHQAMDQLGGGVAKWFTGKSLENESLIAPVAAAYLQAAAVHLQETVQAAGNAQMEAATTKKQYDVVTVG